MTDGRDGAPQDLAELIDGLELYLLTEQRAAQMRDGEGFRLADGTRRWVSSHRRCERYEEDDFFFNLYGYWCLTPE